MFWLQHLLSLLCSLIKQFYCSVCKLPIQSNKAELTADFLTSRIFFNSERNCIFPIIIYNSKTKKFRKDSVNLKKKKVTIWSLVDFNIKWYWMYNFSYPFCSLNVFWVFVCLLFTKGECEYDLEMPLQEKYLLFVVVV